MAEIITMPRLSDTMTEGVVAKWLKQVGDKIEEGDILAEIETDKATMEFESFHEGTLLHIGVNEGETADVDALLAIIGEDGEDYKPLLAQSSNGSDPKADNAISEEVAEEATAPAVEAEVQMEAPAGVEVITMPRLSDTMTEGTVASWLKKVGDKVEEGDILAEIETDKATMEFESFHSGTLLYIGVDEGGSADVDAVLAIIGKEGTDVAAYAENLKNAEASPKQTETKKTPEQEKKSAPAASVKESAPVPAANVQVSHSTGGRVVASPLAKKLATEKNINLSHIQGTGEGGRIIKRDIENYTPGAAGISAMPFVPAGQESFEEVPNSQMRKVIARRLGESKFSAPHYYLNVEFDMDNAIAFRTQYNS
ncbi:MAG: E3 binding domain-containing protein, partial [Flavobacteriaceae bacterium]